MNRIAVESRLLGAQVLGLQNLVVVQGDPIIERDHATPVADYKATDLIEAIARLNQGIDHRNLKLRSATDFCVGASVDLGQGIKAQASLTARKVAAGAQFFITQPVFTVSELEDFLSA